MRVFVTGATGGIGSLVVAELLANGHEVVGMARSDASAEALRRAGAEARRGDLSDLAGLRSGAADADGVIHLAFTHDFGNFDAAQAADAAAVGAMTDALAGSDRPLVIASGVANRAPGTVLTETDMPDGPDGTRAHTELTLLAAAARGVRTAAVRLAPTVHAAADRKGFTPSIIDVARDKGFSAYIGDGSNRWTAVHRLDAAHLFRLVVENAPAGTAWHGVADEAIAFREIAETIGRRLGVPTRSIDQADSDDHFGWLSFVIGTDMPASNARTRQELGWDPTHPGLLADLDTGFGIDDRT